MTTFLDGPAQGQILMLKRAPVLLRVVLEAGPGRVGDRWDALDQLYDHARPSETVYAYELAVKPSAAFIDGPRISGRYPIAQYKLVDPQPEEAIMRSNAAWAEWANRVGPEKVIALNCPLPPT